MNLLNEKVVDNAKKKDYNGKKKTYYFILLLKGRDDMTNIKKILATTLSILVVISGSMATNAMVAVPNVPHQPFMPPIVGVPTVNSGQLSFKSIKTQIANFFSLSSKTDGQLKNTENLYSDESEEIGGQWEDNNEVYDKIQWKFNPKNGTLTVTGTGAIPYMDGHKKPWVKKQINNDQVKTLVIGEGITEVGNCAFCIMTSLQKVYLPKSVTCLNIHAFFNCNSLEEMNFEDSSLTTIGMGALESNNFSKIKLPSSLTNLGYRAFAFNENLKEVKFCGTASPVCGSNVFENCVNLTDVNVPECFENNAFCGKNVSKILDHGSCTEPESSSSMESSQSSSESSGSMESSQSSSKLSSSSISEVNFGSKRIELIFSKEDIQISSVEESIKDIIDLDPGQYKITVKVIDDEEVKVTVQFVNEDDLNEFHKKVSECTK